MKFSRIFSVIFGLVILTQGCGSGDDASDGSGSEVAISAVSGATISSEGSAAGAFRTPPKATYYAWERNLLGLPEANASGTCEWFGTGGAPSCSGSSLTFTMSSCSFSGSLAVWNGSETFTFSGCSCTNSPAGMALLGSGCSVTRSFSSLKRTAVTGYAVTVDSLSASGYKTPQNSGGGAQVSCGTSCASSRSISILGQHLTGTTPTGGTYWDHTVFTTSPITVTGAGTSRQITAGTVVVWHNIARFTTTSTFSSPLTFTSNCCFPVGGSITTTFSGSAKLDGKSETLSFGPTCGKATLTDTKGSSGSYQLTHCL